MCPLFVNGEETSRRTWGVCPDVLYHAVELCPTISCASPGQCYVQAQTWASETVPVGDDVYSVWHGDWVQVCVALGHLLTQSVPRGDCYTGEILSTVPQLSQISKNFSEWHLLSNINKFLWPSIWILFWKNKMFYKLVKSTNIFFLWPFLGLLVDVILTL